MMLGFSACFADTKSQEQSAMFPCACSLRSTQCAALIALAAAAGIMRVESQPPESRSNGSSSTLAGQFSSSVDLGITSDIPHYEIAGAFAPWLRLAQLAAEMSNLASPPVASPPLAPLVRPRFAVSPAPHPSPAQHSFPFAVGPPRRNINNKARADDTTVSRDSAARCMSVSRIAALTSSDFARTSRNENRVLTWTVSVFNPSSALRGGLAGFPSLRPFAEPTDSFRPRIAANVESFS
jgi:hypothetical protein